MTKKNLSSLEKLLYKLKLEESRLEMNNSVSVFDKSILIYFLFLFVGVIGFINDMVNLNMLYIIVIMGMFVLLIGLIPYIRGALEHSRFLEVMIHKLEKKRK
jgi:hypothetical protein